MFNFKRLFSKINKEELPKIVYGDKSSNLIIFSWLSKTRIALFEAVLFHLGFKSGDTVYLYNCAPNELNYSVNKDEINLDNKIILGWVLPEVEVHDGKNIYTYRVISSKRDLYGVMSYKLSHTKKISENVTTFRYYGASNFFFNVNNDDFKIGIEVFLNYGKELQNKDKLKEYLINLKRPILIEEVYAKICEIACVDASCFESFELYAEATDKNQESRKITDLMLIQKGELKQLKRTVDGKTIYFDGDNWGYEDENSSLVTSVSFEQEERKLKYSFVFSEVDDVRWFDEDGVKLRDLALDEVSRVIDKVEDTKKLVRTMLNRDIK